jgi:hypothetical protein
LEAAEAGESREGLGKIRRRKLEWNPRETPTGFLTPTGFQIRKNPEKQQDYANSAVPFEGTGERPSAGPRAAFSSKLSN